MKIVIIDGQGGGLGKQLVQAFKEAGLGSQVLAVGTNSTASTAMLRSGADRAATGENAVVVAARQADFIVGSLGIAIADSMMGEITPLMATAVGQSSAKRVLIPMNFCSSVVVGTAGKSLGDLVKEAVEVVKKDSSSC